MKANIRTCDKNVLVTGKSACPIDFDKIRAIILIEHGKAFPSWANVLGINYLQMAVHGRGEDSESNALPRIFPITDIVEYARNGGEPQTTSVGYGGVGVTGISARTDTFTLNRYSELIAAYITKNMNRKFDAYYIDDSNVVYGISDGKKLYGFPMNTVYCTATPHPTSSALATLTVSLCFNDARKAIEQFDYIQLSYNPIDYLDGLVAVDLVEMSSGKYKVLETYGGYDRTEEFAEATAQCFDNVATVSYANGYLTITLSEGATAPLLKPASELFVKGIHNMEYNKTIKL